MKLIVGLGNIGKEYENTRHNIGFMVLDSFIQSFTFEKKFHSMIYKDKINEEEVIFMKPTTFMNLSGIAVRKITDYYHIDIKDILVVHDDLDLSFGQYKLKENSSSGGHNGIKSIIENLGTNEFARLKIGISKSKEVDTKDYVLSKFSKSEINCWSEFSLKYKEIINFFIENDITKTLNQFNYKKQE